MILTWVWAWLQWQVRHEPVEFAAVAIFVLGVPAGVAWMVWLDRRTRAGHQRTHDGPALTPEGPR